MVNEEFQWKRYPEIEKYLQEKLELCCQKNQPLSKLRDELQEKCSTRLFDWVDHLALPENPETLSFIQRNGYKECDSTGSQQLFDLPGAQLPSLLLCRTPTYGAAIKVDAIEDFFLVRGRSAEIEGSPYSGYRRALAALDGGVHFWVVERRGDQVVSPVIEDEGYLERYLYAKELWKCRNRSSSDEAAALSEADELVDEIVALLGESRAAWVILEVEREYWQARNGAAQIQKNRQDRLGMGWANHDHHTFRSSRRHFLALVQLFEKLGFSCRERFYAGEEAGWGAQVMENHPCRLVLFLDVDFFPHELDVDFSHQQLPEGETLGTIGLWCGLHGDSIAKSGMHHLEAQFVFDQLREDLGTIGVKMMEPFSHFTYLKQAFTAGEVWPVAEENIARLLSDKKITKEQAERFRTSGAIGSHLENLERHEGYKGFNQKNVSFIIKKTDPRTAR